MGSTRTLSTQKLVYEDISWAIGSSATPASFGGSMSVDIDTIPTGVASDAPYWTFTYEISKTFGLKISNIEAVNTQKAGSTEPVFSAIEFLEIQVSFTDGSTANFDINKAFGNIESVFEEGEQGQLRSTSSYNPKSTPDPLFQRGVYLKLVDDFGGTCKVTVELSAVFRGSAADFDPGGIPVAMKIYPQASFQWESIGIGGKLVKSFHCLIKPSNENYMSHDMDMMDESMTMPPMENVAGFYTDSNMSMTDGRQLSNYGYGVFARGGRFQGKPFGWALVFDYLAKLSTETEIIGVYGPDDTGFYDTGRTKDYSWGTGTITLSKAERQGKYDNIHIHAKMPSTDLLGNQQIHAPFCGHSCVHMHWRWSSSCTCVL